MIITPEELCEQLEATTPKILPPVSPKDGPTMVGRPGVWAMEADAFACAAPCSHGGVCVRVYGHDGQHTTAFCDPWDAS